MLGQGRLIRSMMLFTAISLSFVGCSSSKKKYEQREKAAASSGLFCDFVNGDKFKEVEIELNMSMAKKCDPEKPYSVTNYKTVSDVTGLIYCCNMKRSSETSPKAQSGADKKTGAPQSTKSGEEPDVTL